MLLILYISMKYIVLLPSYLQDNKLEALTYEDRRSYINALSISLPKVSWESELFKWGVDNEAWAIR